MSKKATCTKCGSKNVELGPELDTLSPYGALIKIRGAKCSDCNYKWEVDV